MSVLKFFGASHETVLMFSPAPVLTMH